VERFEFIIAKTPKEYNIGKELFIEYANSKKFNLEYQNFDKELIEIHNQYGYPFGGLCLIKNNNDNYVGCGGIRKFKEGIAELKRMYIKEEFRGKGLGKKLLDRLIKLAIDLNYNNIWLDTLETLQAATHLYKIRGFKEIEPYRFNPRPDVLYFELELCKDKYK
jgi:putative acetyltransferase